MATAVQPHTRGAAPFDMSGIERGPDGIARYVDRPASLIEMLRTSVERSPQGSECSRTALTPLIRHEIAHDVSSTV